MWHLGLKFQDPAPSLWNQYAFQIREKKNPNKKLNPISRLCIFLFTKLSGIPDLIVRQQHKNIKVSLLMHMIHYKTKALYSLESRF